jgi:hypothetical protein
MKIKFEKSQVVESIGYDQICRNAKFVFDKPIKMEPSDTLELLNGSWSLISQGVRIPMHGRWDR